MPFETLWIDKAPIMVLVVILVVVPDALDGCSYTTRVDLTGSDVTDIPRNLNGDVDCLRISDTNINVLNLTVAADYSRICRLEVRSSPVSTLVTPNPPQTVALTFFYLACGHFPTPPDLGIVLSIQLKYLSFVDIGIITIPGSYFQNYSKLVSLSLFDNPITTLNSENLAGLRRLRTLYLTRTNVNPIPALNLWLPTLRELHIASVGITLLPRTLIANLYYLRKLYLKGNQLYTIPEKENFVNLQNMIFIDLSANPLCCDSRIAWMKVIAMKYMMTSSSGNIFRFTGPFCGKFTGHRWIPLTKAKDAELLYFLWSAPQ